MNFKIDENLPDEAAFLFLAAGFGADTVREEGLSGADDGVIAVTIRREQRILITLDLDFSDIRNYPPNQFAGIIVLRSKAQDNQSQWIVESDRIRYRRIW